jgi:SAM-dependent methyltransferase
MVRGRSREQAEFIALCTPPASEALEVGCGNGRLLIELASRGAITGGTGIDLADSRIEFANRWAADEGLSSLEFQAGDALRRPLTDGRYGVAMCVTAAFAYFDAVLPGSAAALLERLSRALETGGLLVLELYPHESDRRLIEDAGKELRQWSELPVDDPWRFYLSEFSMDGDVLTHRKTFVHRTTGLVDEGRCERMRLYSQDELHKLLAGSGFEDVCVYGGWNRQPYEGQEVMVVTARNGRDE